MTRNAGAGLLLAAGTQLATYREPDEAYEEETHPEAHIEHQRMESS